MSVRTRLYLDTSGRVGPAHPANSTGTVKLGEADGAFAAGRAGNVGRGGGGPPLPVVWAGCLCAGFPASAFNTCHNPPVAEILQPFSPKEVG